MGSDQAQTCGHVRSADTAWGWDERHLVLSNTRFEAGFLANLGELRVRTTGVVRNTGWEDVVQMSTLPLKLG